jgi:hypothetical protein
MVLSMQTVIDMKKGLDENFGLYLHFHDRCGGQSFGFDDAPAEGAVDWICEYLKKLGARADFFDGGRQFTVSKL